MKNGLDISWQAAFSEGRMTERRATRSFKSLIMLRLFVLIIGTMLLGVGFIIGLLTWMPRESAGIAAMCGIAFMLAEMAVLFFYLMPTWCSQTETITFVDDGFESALHGRIYCKDIVTYALSTFLGSDKSIRIVTGSKTIGYNIRPNDAETHAWLALHVKTMVDDFNAAAMLKKSEHVDVHADSEHAPAAAVSDEHDGPAIKEDSFFKSPGAGVLVGVGFLISFLMLFAPASGGSHFGIVILLFGSSASMLGMIIRARNQG